MVEFLRKFESYSIKITRVNSIIITKSINLLTFCAMFGSIVIYRAIFRAQSIYREIYDSTNQNDSSIPITLHCYLNVTYDATWCVFNHMIPSHYVS